MNPNDFVTHRHALHACPTCSYKMDASTCITRGTKKEPLPGDFTLCARCGEILVYDQNLVPTIATISDILDAGEENSRLLDKLQKAIRRDRPIK